MAPERASFQRDQRLLHTQLQQIRSVNSRKHRNLQELVLGRTSNNFFRGTNQLRMPVPLSRPFSPESGDLETGPHLEQPRIVFKH